MNVVLGRKLSECAVHPLACKNRTKSSLLKFTKHSLQRLALVVILVQLHLDLALLCE